MRGEAQRKICSLSRRRGPWPALGSFAYLVRYEPMWKMGRFSGSSNEACRDGVVGPVALYGDGQGSETLLRLPLSERPSHGGYSLISRLDQTDSCGFRSISLIDGSWARLAECFQCPSREWMGLAAAPLLFSLCEVVKPRPVMFGVTATTTQMVLFSVGLVSRQMRCSALADASK